VGLWTTHRFDPSLDPSSPVIMSTHGWKSDLFVNIDGHPWTGSDRLGVKGSQVQILSSRRCLCRSGRVSPFGEAPVLTVMWQPA
jgi:hypothetical protein